MKIEFNNERGVDIGGGLLVDFEHQTCLTPGGKVVPLDRGEVITLTGLLPGSPRTTRELAFFYEFSRNNAIPPGGPFVSDNHIWTNISRLRRKLGRDVITHKRRTGYKLNV